MSKFGRGARSDLKRLGRPVTVVTPTNPVRNDDHGDYHYTDTTEVSTKADMVFRGGPNFEKYAAGVGNSRIAAIVWLLDDISVQTGGDAMDEAATYIKADQMKLIVRRVFQEDNGLQRLNCEAETL